MKYPYFSFLYILLILLSSSLLEAQNVKVFILAGQSNMQGHGNIDPPTENGSLSNFMQSPQASAFSYLQNPDGSWATRDDVWVRYDHEDGNLIAGILDVGFGSYDGQIGPELGFGHLLGEHCGDQVLLVKTCWGGKSLAVDFRPPSSGGAVGPYYTQMLADVASAIQNIGTEFPQYTGGQIEIAGFCWFQGWNDGEEEAYLNEYEANLKNLINDVRTDLSIPNLPFVVALAGNGGFDQTHGDGWMLSLQTILVPAQINAVQDPSLSNVAYAETRDFWRAGALSPEPTFVHHWNNNAESYLRIGNELGLEMIEILNNGSISQRIKAKVMLQGAFNGTDMNTTLQTQNLIPEQHPFTNPIYGHTGTENVLTASLPADVVDWILMEIRDPNNSTKVLATRAGLLRKDGMVLDLDGTEGLLFNDLCASSGFVVIRHRNHLGVMTNTVQTF